MLRQARVPAERHRVGADITSCRRPGVQCPFPSRKIKLTGESPGGTGGRAFRIHEEGNLMAQGVHACVCGGWAAVESPGG